MSLGADAVEWKQSDSDFGSLSVRLVDTTDAVTEYTASSDCLWHALWIRDESNASITVANESQRTTWAIAPGDACLIPSGATYQVTGGQLAIVIERKIRADSPRETQPPTHGSDEMVGHNRRTALPGVDGLSVARWKLTEPLELDRVHERSALVVALSGQLVVTSQSVMEPLRRGQAAIITSVTNATIYPDGLAYVLVVEATSK
jgi:mannose-6-phosphate isomerase class I